MTATAGVVASRQPLAILMLEDNPLDAELTCAALGFAENECSITRVDNGPAFETEVKRNCHDVILADYSLPQFDGGRALRLAQQHCPDTPFIFVSGALGEELAIDTLRQGATDYVLKHRLERLRPAVLRALREKEARLERQRAEDRLRQLAEENARLYEDARRANQAKDRFIATISHELRTPMTAILGWTRMLKLGDLSPQDLEMALNAVERSATVQAQLIEDLLDVSRIATGKLTLDFDTVDLAEVVVAASDAIRVAADEKHIRIKRTGADVPVIVRGDRNRLQQVVGNLLQNAVKFTPNGGRVDVELSRDGDAVVRVKDNGIGIRAEFLPALFEAFSQDETGKETKIGLGLGLSIVRHIVERHAGSVTAESEGEGCGATFTVRLPLLMHEKGAAARKQRAPGMPDLAGLNVLVVEDDPDTRNLITTVLTRCGASTSTAASVQEALPFLNGRTWDLIVSDIAMPIQDGYAFIAAVRERLGKAAPPVVAVTAFGTPEDRRRVATAGFTRHILKPIDPLVFAQTIATVARRATQVEP